LRLQQPVGAVAKPGILNVPLEITWAIANHVPGDDLKAFLDASKVLRVKLAGEHLRAALAIGEAANASSMDRVAAMLSGLEGLRLSTGRQADVLVRC
jgi:hypothetical protein